MVIDNNMIGWSAAEIIKPKEILDRLDAMTFVISKKGKFLDCYPGLLGDFLYASKSTLIGRKFDEVLPQELSLMLNEKINELYKHGEVCKFEYKLEIRRKCYYFECSLSLLNDDEEPPVVCLINEITRRKKAELELIRYDRLLNAVVKTNQMLIGSSNILLDISNGLKEIGEAVGVDRCYLFQNHYDEVIGEMVCSQKFEWSKENVLPQIDNPELQNIPFSANIEFMEPLIKGLPFICIVRNIKNENLRKVLENQNIVSLLALPIFNNDNFWGFVGFDDCFNERDWSINERSILLSLVTSITAAISRNEYQHEMLDSKNKAEEASKAKSLFVSNITHELRTPMNGIIGNIDLLAEYEFDGENQVYFDGLKESANYLTKLIDDVLDFSIIESGTLTINSTVIKIDELVKNSIAEVSHIIDANLNQLKINFEKLTINTIYADQIRLKQVIVNLLSNASKFTSNGVIEIEISNDPVQIMFKIKDNGVGLSQSKKSGGIFRLESDGQKHRGAGLGLSIARKVLEYYDSELQLVNNPQGGTIAAFGLRLEAVKLPKNIKIESAIAKKYWDFSIKLENEFKVLVVEDNKINQTLILNIVKTFNSDISIKAVSNGLEAVEYYAKYGADIIFMDLQMPVMDGMEATNHILERDADSYIVALTASSTNEVKKMCVDVGMKDFISKPFTKIKVYEAILKRLGQLQSHPIAT